MDVNGKKCNIRYAIQQQEYKIYIYSLYIHGSQYTNTYSLCVLYDIYTTTYSAGFDDCYVLLSHDVFELRRVAGPVYPAAWCFHLPPLQWNFPELVLAFVCVSEIEEKCLKIIKIQGKSYC